VKESELVAPLGISSWAFKIYDNESLWKSHQR